MALSSLDEIAKYLEQHENSQRIKKLIFSGKSGPVKENTYAITIGLV